ncbi:YdcF family protein [Ralstonia solanacearum]|uniref:YdcF family protein n=1 Tax=Ralstonia solanacearum TaxID=305 RepID=UPI0018D1886D|nr:YdcF family protein [Ralstonia solanacearum]
MSLPVLFLLVIVTAICALRRQRRTARGLAVVSLALFVAIGCGPVPAWLLDSLEGPFEARPAVAWGKRNAIVLLGAGTRRVDGGVEPGVFSYPRLMEAAQQYQACRKTDADCKILVSGGDARHHGDPEAAVYRRALQAIGIDAGDVLLEPNSMNTWQNAQFSRAALAAYAPERTVLVSSAIHLRRGLLYFTHFGMTPTPVRADDLQATPSPLPLAINFAMTDYALHEWIGIARYHVYNALGWNPARVNPGEA